MGTFDFLTLVEELLHPSNVWLDKRIYKELSGFIESLDMWRAFVVKYNVYIERISKQLRGAADGVEWFAPVKGESDLWCVKFKKSKLPNIRILLTFEGKEVFLLHAFCEQTTKEYAKAIKTAKGRM